MSFETFKVAELFYNLELLLKDKFDEKNINLTIDIKPIDLELTADRNYIEQVFINLIKNSCDAIQNSNGIIILRAFKNENNKVILEISDNGVGIPEDVTDKIFIPFFTTKEHGSGIGLSLAQQIMRLHGGSITFNSVKGDNTKFILSF